MKLGLLLIALLFSAGVVGNDEFAQPLKIKAKCGFKTGGSKIKFEEVELNSKKKNSKYFKPSISVDKHTGIVLSVNQTKFTCEDEDCAELKDAIYLISLKRVINDIANKKAAREKVKKTEGKTQASLKVIIDKDNGELKVESLDKDGKLKKTSGDEEVELSYDYKIKQGPIRKKSAQSKCKLTFEYHII